MNKSSSNNWKKKKIDPAFDNFIKIFKDFLKNTNFPKTSGFVADKEMIEKVQIESLPSIIDQYGAALNPQKMFEAATSIGLNADTNRIQAFGGSMTQCKNLSDLISIMGTIFELIEVLENEESKTYYTEKFAPLHSMEAAEDYFKNTSQQEILHWVNNLNYVFGSLFFHINTKDYWKETIEGKANIEKLLGFMLPHLYDAISIVTHKKPLLQLIKEAKTGNDESLLKAIQIDKTLCGLDWAINRIRKAQLLGDVFFFEKLGDAIKKEPLQVKKSYKDGDNPANLVELILVLHTFWNLGLCRLTIEEQFDFLSTNGIEIHENLDSYKRFLSRLKKEGVLCI